MSPEEVILANRLLNAADLFCDSQKGCSYCPLSKNGRCALDDLNDILGNISIEPVKEAYYKMMRINNL